MIQPHVKWAVHVSRVADIAPMLELAFKKAMEGVPGPVFVELPIDVLYAETNVRDDMSKRLPPPTSLMNRVQMSRLSSGCWLVDFQAC